MKFLRGVDELKQYLSNSSCQIGCLADTGFLYGLAYEDDRLFNHANDIHDALAEASIPIYANVISRLELIDLVFRKQVTNGCIQIFNSMKSSIQSSETFNALKYIRDKDTEAKRKHESYKIDERRLKTIRKNIDSTFGVSDWNGFCSKYIGTMLETEWSILEQEFGLNFVEVLEGQMSPLFNSPLYWKDMVNVMSKYGQRGPDAMIINLFLQSKFPLLITSDGDFETCLADPQISNSDKAILIL
ncbi:MAG: hypothetical protein JNM24_17620 [Bdellovibrionaceae bacterium]|nr:hypothetical protein [Pseudobdellovibrionaceae bacterium]